MRLFGLNFELNRLVKTIATHTGPETAAALAVFGPVVGWTYIFCYFNFPWALALMVGFNLKRFEIQLSSAVFEKEARKIQKMINDFGRQGATLPPSESTDKDRPDFSKGGK